MDIEKVKKASELNRMLGDLIGSKSDIQRAITDKERIRKGEYVWMGTPTFLFHINHVFVHKSIEDELMEIALELLDMKIIEVEKQISEL